MLSKGEQMAANMAGASAPAQPKSATAAIIGAVSSLIASGLSFAGSRWAQRRNEQLTQSQNQWNLDMWQRQNQYNLPSSQTARLKAAGLNPALIYGNGGIQNEAADAAPAADYHNVQNPAAGIQSPIDPYTASQIRLNEAQAQSLEDANKRENQKQPYTIEQMQEDISQTREKTNEILQSIKNLKFDEQLKSVQYLKGSLDYQFASSTFNDAVDQFKTTLHNLKLVGIQQEFDYNRALQYLSYEIIGWDLSNKRQRALLNIDLQSYRQTEALFEDVQRKVYWDSQNSYMDWRLKGKEEGIMKSDLSLKQLAFWIDARDNPHAFQAYQSFYGFDGSKHIWGGDPFSEFMSGLCDTWRHGINVPISFGFGK